MKLQIEANALYAPLWQTTKRYVISIGGRGGARSYENSQSIIANLKQTKRLFRAAIMRAVHADIRHSIWQECVDRVNQHELPNVDIADSIMEMVCGQNSINAHGFKKSSSDRTAKLKSLAGYTDAYIEEGEEIGEDEFQQLDDSLRAAGSKIHIMLNTPEVTHWIIKRWFNLSPHPDAPGFYTISLKPEYQDEVEVIFSDHTRNPYLAEEVHRRYEQYRFTKPGYYWHMIRGLSPEVKIGRIYTGWKEIPEVPHEARLEVRGIDFGFNPDPAAVVDIYYHNGGYILDEVLYQTDLTNRQLANVILNQPQKCLAIADSAEPKSIAELKEYGVDVVPCEKGADSVRHGIKKVQGLRISFTSRSKNLKREYENYKNKVNKDGEEVAVEDPNCDNHQMAAIRYGFSAILPSDPEREREARQEVLSTRREREAARADTGAL